MSEFRHLDQMFKRHQLDNVDPKKSYEWFILMASFIFKRKTGNVLITGEGWCIPWKRSACIISRQTVGMITGMIVLQSDTANNTGSNKDKNISVRSCFWVFLVRPNIPLWSLWAPCPPCPKQLWTYWVFSCHLLHFLSHCIKWKLPPFSKYAGWFSFSSPA